MTKEIAPPPYSYHFIDLPLTKLHYVKSGSGPPLVMVPATISRIEHWLGLAQFLGQKYTTYYFDLPGHGKSSPFKERFSSDLVAQSIAAFMDELGYPTFNLMGFSFGGVLALKALLQLNDRVDRMILVSPCVSKEAILLSRARVQFLRRFNAFLKKPAVQAKLISLLHNPKYEKYVISTFRKLARVEDNVPLEKSVHLLPASTLDVLTYQIAEVLELQLPIVSEPFRQPLHFIMSVNDPLLDFTTTYNVLASYFSDINSICLTFPYHQPPEILTFKHLQQNYSKLLEYLPD